MATLLLLSVVCVSSDELPPGETEKQWWWLGWTGGIYLLLMVASLFFYTKKREMSDYAHVVTWALILLGAWEAIIGLRQIYGFAYSNHSLFSLTGTFFNPGPYSGYLALVFPLCLYEYYRLKQPASASFVTKIGHYAALAVLMLIVCVLPTGMSRSSWLAAGISSLFVAWRHYDWGRQLKQSRIKNKKRFILYAGVVCLCLFVGLITVFHLKKDSANGRLFMWKISLKAIADRPFTGHGTGGFPVAYGQTQEAYFARGEYTAWEEHVAGSPEYAFNEYLQIAVEWGISALIAGLGAVGFCLWHGIRKRRFGICAGVLSLGVFAFSSYPFQLPVFVITLFVLLFACIVPTHGRGGVLLFSLVIGATSLYLYQTNDYKSCREWTRVRMLYNVGAYESAKKEYAVLYPVLNNRAAFMFEYGRCLNKLEEYDASNRILQEASYLTCDPMVFNVIGKNYQMLGRYEEAEKYFLRSVNRLPGRIYPYYLLAKLYAESAFLQPGKLEFAARMVMEKEPKVQSTAIREMREEVRKLLDN
jgi:O-antigen ligase